MLPKNAAGLGRKRTHKCILDELQTRRELLDQLSKEKWLSLDIHAEPIGETRASCNACKL